MKLNRLAESYINMSGRIYDSEFINLASISEDKIAFDGRTLFLTEYEKRELNSQPLQKFEGTVFIFKYEGSYGLVCDLPIEAYEFGQIRSHELTLPDTVVGMSSNLHGYNAEAAPILLAHDTSIDYETIIGNGGYDQHLSFDSIEIYVFRDHKAEEILERFEDIETLYVADGHHRLDSSSKSKFKNSVLSCVVSFDYLQIKPIHRVLPSIDAQLFQRALQFIKEKHTILPGDSPLDKGRVAITYGSERFAVELIASEFDAFGNNDVYRLNTQIISPAFRIFDSSMIKYIPDSTLSGGQFQLGREDMLIQMHAVSKEEFIESANHNYIMPPKSTSFWPKFPSFLVFKKYRP